MTDHSPADVEAVIERFLKLRRDDRRASIDDALDASDPDSDELRNAALQTIAEERLLATNLDDGASTPVDLPTIDGYDIIDEIGRGGMGVVFEAYQRSTGRRVAIKLLLDAALQSQSARHRFEREVDLIARLQHPNIISVIDSGVRDARYFYVMDFIEGEPLDCRLRDSLPSVPEAMELLAEICAAVDYAHQRGVLHRDLKPSNILIDQNGRPHLLDFGLARTVVPPGDGPAQHSLSMDGQLVGTIAYMAPEQARGDLDAIGIRTDVYGLGAIGYEMVTGSVPTSMDGTLAEVLQRIESIPPEDPGSLRANVPRDIDAILLKCLEKTPEQRYATAAEVAADIGRHQRRESVGARRPGPLLRSSRWISRHRVVVGVTSAAVLVLLSVTAVFVVNAYAQMLEDRAVTATGTGMVDLDDPNRPGGTDTFARDAVALIDTHLSRYPAKKSEFQLRLADLLIKREAFELARSQCVDALAIRSKVYGSNSLEAAQAKHDLARSWYYIGSRTRDREAMLQAHEIYSSALAIRQEKGAPAGDIATTMDHLASTSAMLGMDDQAIALYQKGLEVREATFGSQSMEVMQSRNNLATYYVGAGNVDAAEPLYQAILEFMEGLPPDELPQQKYARSLHALGMVLVEQGKADAAEPRLVKAIDLKRRQTGDQTETIARSIYQLARVRVMQRRFVEARELAEEVIAIREARGSNPDTARELLAEIESQLAASKED